MDWDIRSLDAKWAHDWYFDRPTANVSVVNFPRHGIAVDDRHKKMCPPEVVMEIHEHDENIFRFLYVFVHVTFCSGSLVSCFILMLEPFTCGIGFQECVTELQCQFFLHNFFLTAIASDFFM